MFSSCCENRWDASGAFHTSPSLDNVAVVVVVVVAIVVLNDDEDYEEVANMWSTNYQIGVKRAKKEKNWRPTQNWIVKSTWGASASASATIRDLLLFCNMFSFESTTKYSQEIFLVHSRTRSLFYETCKDLGSGPCPIKFFDFRVAAK